MSEKYIRVSELGVSHRNPDVFNDPERAHGWNELLRIIQSAPTYTPADILAGMWVPVTPETMPDYDVPVFVSDGVNTWVDRWRKCGQWDYCEEPDAITHWMPLPGAPKEATP